MASSLTEQELELLEDFLANEMETCNCMPLDMVHGYLTTVISGPGQITPSEWLPQVLGDIELSDQAKTTQIMDLLMRFYDGVLEELAERNYAPLLVYLSKGTEDPLPLPYGWSEGYLKGWELHGEDALNQMLQDETAELMLAPIMVFLMYEEDQLLNPRDEQMHRDTVGELADSAQGIYDWWLARPDSPAVGLQ